MPIRQLSFGDGAPAGVRRGGSVTSEKQHQELRVPELYSNIGRDHRDDAAMPWLRRGNGGGLRAESRRSVRRAGADRGAAVAPRRSQRDVVEMQCGG
jgi:hypothetical protein